MLRTLDCGAAHCIVCFPAAVKAIAAPAGSSSPAGGLKIVEKAKAAVSCHALRWHNTPAH
jgi:hypothetical protein